MYKRVALEFSVGLIFLVYLTFLLITPLASAEKEPPRTEYSKITYFEPGEGIVFPNMELEYSISPQSPNQLKVGNTLFNQSTFLIELNSLHTLDPAFKAQLNLKNEWSILFHWPKALFPNPEIEFISGAGQTVWRKTLKESELKAWNARTDSWKKKLGITASKTTILNSSFGLIGGGEVNRLRELLSKSFKYCVFSNSKKGDTRYCSPLMAIRSGKKFFSQSDLKNRVLIQNEEAQLEGLVKPDPLVPTVFFAEFSLGGSYGFKTELPKTDLVDISEISEDFIKLVGFGAKPNMLYRIVNKDETSQLTRFFGFDSTIKDDRVFWEVQVPIKQPYIYFPGPSGGLFRQGIVASAVPKARARIYVHELTPPSVYLSEVKIKAMRPTGSVVESDQNSIDLSQNQPREFVWNFRAKNKGEINRSYLTVSKNGKQYTSFYEIYRSYQNELSGRFTGILSNSGQVILGEVSYNRWFEKLLGENALSFQRWGLSVRYFKSANPLTVSATQKENLTALTSDLKYRLTPGVWTRDASMGVMFGYQDLVFGDFKPSMLGAGWFWARSMPLVFDRIINWVPFMRYPKWVDMEVIYYLSSLKSNVTLNSPFSINFHGQILWSKSFFGEAGFGLKRYAFIDKSLNQKAELNTFYGTVGLGIKF